MQRLSTTVWFIVSLLIGATSPALGQPQALSATQTPVAPPAAAAATGVFCDDDGYFDFQGDCLADNGPAPATDLLCAYGTAACIVDDGPAETACADGTMDPSDDVSGTQVCSVGNDTLSTPAALPTILSCSYGNLDSSNLGSLAPIARAIRSIGSSPTQSGAFAPGLVTSLCAINKLGDDLAGWRKVIQAGITWNDATPKQPIACDPVVIGTIPALLPNFTTQIAMLDSFVGALGAGEVTDGLSGGDLEHSFDIATKGANREIDAYTKTVAVLVNVYNVCANLPPR